jgi:hypothetical protein
MTYKEMIALIAVYDNGPATNYRLDCSLSTLLRLENKGLVRLILKKPLNRTGATHKIFSITEKGIFEVKATGKRHGNTATEIKYRKSTT